VAFFDAPGCILEVFHFPPVASYSIPLLSRLVFPLPTVLSIYPIMSSSSSKSGSAKQLFENPQPHAFETFRFSKDYEAFWRQVILPAIRGSHDHQYIYYFDKPAFPLPVSFAPSQPLIESFYKLILDTDINLPNHIPFPHYIDYPPCQSASIPIAQRLTTHDHFSLNIPECFISDDNVAYQKGDIVALGPDAHQKVVMEGVMEVGKYFILYEVKEVGSFPIGHIQTTQLVAPLNSHLSVLLCLLALILMALFPCFFQSSAIFGKPGEVSKEEGFSQNWFSDSTLMAWVLTGHLLDNADLSHSSPISFFLLHFILFFYLYLR
jgi:hypothetical protein